MEIGRIGTFGRQRRLGQACHLGSEALASGDIDTFRRRLDRSWVSWRDGSMLGTGGVGNAINPATGLVQSGPMTMDLAIPGCPPIRLGFAWDKIVNLSSGDFGVAGVTASRNDFDLDITESALDELHYAQQNSLSVTGGVRYSFSVEIIRLAGTRHATFYWIGTDSVHFRVDLTTGGVFTSTTAVTIHEATSQKTADGWLVTGSFTPPNTRSFSSVVAPRTNTTAVGAETYQGDGVSKVRFRGFTVVADVTPPLRVAAGITRTADSWIWTLPAALPQDCEISNLVIDPYVDGDIGVASVHWFQNVDGTAGAVRLARGLATRLDAYDYDTGAKTKSVTRTIPNRATAFIQRWRRTPGGIDVGYGANLTGSPTAGGPWVSPTQLYVGHSPIAGRASRAANALIITPGGCTQAERDAEARLFHLKPVGMAA